MAGAPTKDTSWPALLDADLADPSDVRPPRHRDAAETSDWGFYCKFCMFLSVFQVMQRAPGCRSMSQQLRIEVPARPGAPVRSKRILHESRTVQIPIFRCFLSFAVVVKTRNQMAFKTQYITNSRHKLTRTKSTDRF
jgi:hypothetical protein